MREIYLDNSSTTKVCEKAAKSACEAMEKSFGNPSSLHAFGMEAEMIIREARQTVADALNCSPRGIIFTSGGTESNNLAIQGAIRAKKRAGNRIVATAVEHASVYETLRFLEKEGYDVVFLPVKNGESLKEDLFNAVDDKTIIVSMMLINNETGARMPVEYAKLAVKNARSPALIHCDAVQAFGKIPVSPSVIGADMLTVSAHKLHGPKGVGALYVSEKAKILPIFFGGGQERGMRPGTESVPLVAGFSAAIEDTGDMDVAFSHVCELNHRFRIQAGGMDGVFINSPDDALPYIVNISVTGIKSEIMLHYLASEGIYVSSGSACSGNKRSRVLTALGLPAERVDSSLRISFCKNNTVQDVDDLISALKSAQNRLVKSR